jgi:ATP-dependent Clp protease ATP-binding subunit ClpC
MKELLDKEMERHFRPEFLNRLDATIVFHALTRKDLETIVEYELNKVFKRLIEQGLHLELDNAAKEFLIDKGYNPEFGARPLRRAIERYIEDPLSEDLLRGKFKGKSVIRTSVQDEDHLRFEGIQIPDKETVESEAVVVHSAADEGDKAEPDE